MIQSDLDLLPAGNRRIIIVEDDADLRRSVVKYLELKGYDVTGVGSAIEFYRELSETVYGLAIIDIGLPDQSGLILSNYLRINSDIRILILTAETSVECRLSCYQSGADLYLQKPVDFRELSVTVSNLIGRVAKPETTYGGSDRVDAGKVVGDGGHWVLSRLDWSLHVPTGEVLRLTSKEVGLITLLATTPDSVSSRRDILKALDYRNDEYGNRALEAMIRRLRRKMESVVDCSPIKTCHGHGYCFSVPIIIR